MKAKSAKQKGRRLQNHLVGEILKRFPELTEDDIRGAIMGAPGEDAPMSPAARRLIPFSFECKNQESLNIWKACAQASTHRDDTGGAVVFKRNHTTPKVAVELDVFLDLLRAAAPQGG